MFRTDICIAGAGIIGLSLALELDSRGLSVVVLEAGDPMRRASIAAAGMLAARDPENPAALGALAHLSLSLYPTFLDSLKDRGGVSVPLQTDYTLQAISGSALSPLNDSALIHRIPKANSSLPDGFRPIQEHSVDPLQLSTATLAAVANSRVRLLPGSPVVSTRIRDASVEILTRTETIAAAHFVDCTGAWAADPSYTVTPIKGQMLAVALPANFPLRVTVRTSNIYVVPRTLGPSAGRAIIGATIEDVGFDDTVQALRIDALQQAAIDLLPQLANAKRLKSWAGFRPATSDRLPLLGPHPHKPHHWVAAGHYRNGILLAPATAQVMAQLLLDQVPSSSLKDFSPSRQQLRSSSSG